jgi:hypothetical protein
MASVSSVTTVIGFKMVCGAKNGAAGGYGGAAETCASVFQEA